MSARFASIVWGYADRSIERLVDLACSLTAEERSWRPAVDGANSIATLVGHTLANAEDNVLGTLLGLPYAYDRERDFEAPETDASAIRARFEALRTAAAPVALLDDDDLARSFTHARRGEVLGIDLLLVVARHAAEHLAHAELTRDLLRAAVPSTGAQGGSAR